MINHTVLFKLKEQTTATEKQALIDALQNLKSEISELKEIQVKENFSDRSKDFKVILFSLFNSKADLDAYQVHPAHVRVVKENVKPILEDILVSDIEY